MNFGISSPFGSGHASMTTVQDNVRTLLAGRNGADSPNSLYSRTPILGAGERQSHASKRTSRSFMRRYLPGFRPDVDHPDLPINRMPSLNDYSPATQPSEWTREPAEPTNVVLPDRHPSDPIPHADAELDHEEVADGDIESLGRVRKHRRYRRRKHRHHRKGAWVRRRSKRGPSRTCASLLRGHTRVKCIITIISGLFLALILTIYLTLALTIHGLSQELHVLFILIILAASVLFVHSLIRLCVLAGRGPEHHRRRRNAIPSVAGPDGFTPDVPIRVHLARDEEIAAQGEDGKLTEEKMTSLKAPPPAYGLWRCSVRVNPALLHWQRVEGENSSQERSSTAPSSPLESVHENVPAARPEGPRPPSYVSDDGVEYVVSAAPRNTVFMPQPTDDVHPAYRECV